MSNFIEENSELIMLRSMVNVFMPEALDPVGKEDADIDNDGDTDSSDKYLHKRRKAIGKAIAAEKGKKKGMKEEMEASLRQKMEEATALHHSKSATTSDEKQVEITEKPVNNKITVNPEMKESVSNMILRMYEDKYIGEGLKQARKNVGASTCWDGYTAKGTKKKNGKEVPNCVKEEEVTEGKKKGLWDNIHAKRKRGEKPAKPGDEDYPKTLNVENLMHRLAEARRGPAAPGKEEKGESAKKSLAALNKRQKKLDKYEKETGRKADITKSPEYKTHKMRHPGSRQEKKKRGEKETELQQHNRRTTRHNERLMKHGPTKKEAERQKGYDAYEKKHKSKYGNRSVWD